MPWVTVLVSPSGEPIATTGWPTCVWSESPIANGCNDLPPSILSTARS
jgi:hypothetical protein